MDNRPRDLHRRAGGIASGTQQDEDETRGEQRKGANGLIVQDFINARSIERTKRITSEENKRRYLIPDEEWMASIKRRRKALGLTQKELAERIGMSLNQYAGYELGNTRPKEDTRARIERALKRLEEEKRRGVDNNAARTQDKDLSHKRAGKIPPHGVRRLAVGV